MDHQAIAAFGVVAASLAVGFAGGFAAAVLKFRLLADAIDQLTREWLVWRTAADDVLEIVEDKRHRTQLERIRNEKALKNLEDAGAEAPDEQSPEQSLEGLSTQELRQLARANRRQRPWEH